MHTLAFTLSGHEFFLQTRDLASESCWLNGLTANAPLPRGLGIVGTRRSHAWSRSMIERTVRQSATQDQITVVSGLAHGVDSWAHESAIHAGLPTLAIVPAAFKPSYLRLGSLAHQIIDSGGAIVGLKPESAPVFKSDFLERNRWIAWWSSAIWVVQAPIPSGALNTAKWGRELGRPVFATPSRPGDPDFAGNEQLLSRDCAIPFWNYGALGWSSTIDLFPGSKNNFGFDFSPEQLWLLKKLDWLTRKNGGSELLRVMDEFSVQYPANDSFFDWIQLWTERGWIEEDSSRRLRLSEQVSQALKRAVSAQPTSTV